MMTSSLIGEFNRRFHEEDRRPVVRGRVYVDGQCNLA